MVNWVINNSYATADFADLTISTGEIAIENDKLICQVTIRNIGSKSSEETYVKFGKNINDLNYLPALTPHEEYKMEYTLVSPIPSGIITVTVDPFNYLYEANKLNNSFQLPWFSEDQPDLQITDFTFYADDSSQNITTDSKLNVSFSVFNNSKTDISNHRVELYIFDINNKPAGDLTVVLDFLPAGEKKSISYSCKNLPPGAKIIKAELFENGFDIPLAKSDNLYTTVVANTPEIPVFQIHPLKISSNKLYYSMGDCNTELSFFLTNKSNYTSTAFRGEIRLRKLWENDDTDRPDEFYIKGYKSIIADITEIGANKTMAVSVNLGELEVGGWQAELHLTESGNRIIPLDNGAVAPICEFDVYSKEYLLPATPDVPLISVDNSKRKVSLYWNNLPTAEKYFYRQSVNNFNSALTVEVTGNSLSCYNLANNNLQWQVQEISNTATALSHILPNSYSTGGEIIAADDDNISDLFFAIAKAVWENGYYAQHQGNELWQGTMETLSLEGKMRISDCFYGSNDKNVLYLTDNVNGDGLFVDDKFTKSSAETQSRLKNLNEIRAGAGDDVIDLTSNSLNCGGFGLIVRGGAGNDTIWANSGNNHLFGDGGDDRIIGGSGDDCISGGAGNDSLHGGGGNDIFCFGKNWGRDTVVQLTEGKITLWFDEGDLSKWDSENLCYDDGDNQVKVSGVEATQISIKFTGDAGFDDLQIQGLFAATTSEKVYEEFNYAEGILAAAPIIVE